MKISLPKTFPSHTVLHLHSEFPPAEGEGLAQLGDGHMLIQQMIGCWIRVLDNSTASKNTHTHTHTHTNVLTLSQSDSQDLTHHLVIM